MCRSALLLSFCENRFCLSQLIKKLKSTERGALLQHFCVSKVITTAHAHKSGVIFHFFQELSNKKIKALRPKMTKIASRGPGMTPWGYFSHFESYFSLFESSCKNEKWHHFCAHAQLWPPWRRKNVEKKHLTPWNLTFLLIAIDTNGFRRMKEEGQRLQNDVSDFLIFV